MASPHPFHERPGPVSDTAGENLSYAFCSLAVSVDSMVKMAS
jgi:hypothetical protein